MKNKVVIIAFLSVIATGCSSSSSPVSTPGKNLPGTQGTPGDAPNSILPNVDPDASIPVIPQFWQRSLSLSETYACAITPREALKCWGDNSFGTFATGDKTSKASAVDSVLTSGVKSISAGPNSACANVNGAAQCWGSNSAGQLGTSSIQIGADKESLNPVQVDGLTENVTSIATGGSFACAVVSGAVKCWGTNTYGTMGINTHPFETETSFDPGDILYMQTPIAIPGLSTGVTLVTAGLNHACALINGGVKCWGKGDKGQLGKSLANTAYEYSPTPVDVEGLGSGVVEIAAGDEHTCAILSDGTIKCWGVNDKGQLGDGTTTNQTTPVLVAGISSGATHLAPGTGNSCAVVNGKLNCWGYNSYGQLGNHNQIDQLAPVEATVIPGVIIKDAVSRGENTCVMKDTSEVLCWGYNSHGELGIDDQNYRLAPDPVRDFPTFY